jgi:hypothetical protein
VSTAIAIHHSPAEAACADARQLGAEISELCSYIYAAESRLLALIHEFDKKQYWADLGLHSCAHWLNFKCGIGMNAAREKVRVAHALAELPKINERFANGALSYSKVRAMTRIANESNEDYLLMIAKHGTAHHVEKLVSKYRMAKRLRDNQNADEQHKNRELTHYYDQDGCLVIKARLPAEQGALIIKALEMAMDSAFAETPKPTTVGAASRREINATAEIPKGPEPIAARRADALAEIAETYMNNCESSGSTADRYQVVVHVHPEGTSTAEKPHIDNGPHVTAETSTTPKFVGAVSCRETNVHPDDTLTAETPHIEDGPGVTAETSKRIACDSSIVTIKEDENGEPLSIGRRSRTIPPPMRRALRNRDKGCRFPGCTNTRFVDGHHIRHWADGGETSLDNLVLLCRRHHHLVHEGGFACRKSHDGEICFKDQRKQPLESFPVLPGIAANDDVLQWVDREFFAANIDSETCTAKWYAGERMDWDLAVGALF